jgi:hypothetical protein
LLDIVARRFEVNSKTYANDLSMSPLSAEVIGGHWSRDSVMPILALPFTLILADMRGGVNCWVCPGWKSGHFPWIDRSDVDLVRVGVVNARNAVGERILRLILH